HVASRAPSWRDSEKGTRRWRLLPPARIGSEAPMDHPTHFSGSIMPNLTGKVAIVTGSTKGIGLAVAEHVVAAGGSVVVSSRTQADVEATAERLGERAIGIVCDVSDPDDCRSLVERTVRLLGRLDILVNNAGLGIFKPISELTVEEFRLQIDVNLGGVFYCSRAALKPL